MPRLRIVKRDFVHRSTVVDPGGDDTTIRPWIIDRWLGWTCIVRKLKAIEGEPMGSNCESAVAIKLS